MLNMHKAYGEPLYAYLILVIFNPTRDIYITDTDTKHICNPNKKRQSYHLDTVIWWMDAWMEEQG